MNSEELVLVGLVVLVVLAVLVVLVVLVVPPGWSRRVLCGVGAVPVLAVLLQSSDSRVQFYGCAALCNLAADGELRGHLLRAGERHLLKALLTLMSSPVHKVWLQGALVLGFNPILEQDVLTPSLPVH